MKTCKCENGWLEIDDMWYKCPTCVVSNWPERLVEEKTRPESVAMYLYRLSNEMGLKEWKFNIEKEPCADTEYATVVTIYGQRTANINLCEDWNKMTGDEQRYVLTHELVHCHLGQLGHFFSDIMHERRGEATAARAWLLHEEMVTDAIASAWAPALPLPNGGRCAR